jgi:hypothetical protein
VVVTTTAAATPDPAVATTDDSQVALRQLLSAVSTAKAQLAQYQQDLDAICGGFESKQCWTALRYSQTVGTEVTDTLGRVSQRPAEVADLWNSTFGTGVALMSLDAGWCAPGRAFNDCYSHVFGTVQRLTQQFAGWDPYLARQ